jgi:hypothetical protein
VTRSGAHGCRTLPTPSPTTQLQPTTTSAHPHKTVRRHNATGQIVLTFVGPTSSPVFGSSFGATGASATDTTLVNGQRPGAYTGDVNDFVTAAQQTAVADGLVFNQSNVFTTGHSLGGYAAQYAASQNGFGDLLANGLLAGVEGMGDVVTRNSGSNEVGLGRGRDERRHSYWTADDFGARPSLYSI